MSDTANKPMTLLIVLNVVFLMVIVWLIGMMMGKDSNPVISPAAVITAPEPVTPIQQVVPELASSSQPDDVMATPLTESIEQIVNLPASELPEPEVKVVERVHNIDVYYDGDIVRMEESDDRGNMHVVISNSLKEIDKIAPQDESYLAALNELKQGGRRHVSMTTVTRETAEKKVELRPQTASQDIDYFNKVDVSARQGGTQPARRQSLADQIANVVAEDDVKPNASDAEYAQTSMNAYVTTLAVESEVRANELRTIKVKRGDSLWMIAVRAYGNGFEYPRIYAANPHLKNPDLIREGDTLRVPL